MVGELCAVTSCAAEDLNCCIITPNFQTTIYSVDQLHSQLANHHQIPPFIPPHLMATPTPIPTESNTEWYSVWALPPESLRPRLKRVMSGLRAEFGGPEFEPHVTVVGAIRLTPESAVEMIRAATSGFRPYRAKVASVSRGTFFYQCVYLLIEPSEEVVQASAHCCSHFGYQSSTPYMPHLSLLYQDLTDEEKEKAVKKAEELDKEICGLEFEISELALYKTDTEDKSLKSWERIEVCRLDGK